MNSEILTIGFARRAAAYKRETLWLQDTDRLKRLADESGGLQLIFSGKAHPADDTGKSIIRELHRSSAQLSDKIKMVYISNYDMYRAKLLGIRRRCLVKYAVSAHGGFGNLGDESGGQRRDQFLGTGWLVD